LYPIFGSLWIAYDYYQLDPAAWPFIALICCAYGMRVLQLTLEKCDQELFEYFVLVPALILLVALILRLFFDDSTEFWKLWLNAVSLLTATNLIQWILVRNEDDKKPGNH
jgi:phosphatidylserine synthase